MESGMINRLPDDAIIEILKRFSVRSLLRFRCVCKVWCNLIKSPYLITKHFNHPTCENDHRVLIKRCLHDRVTNVFSIHSNKKSLDIFSPDLQIPFMNDQPVQLFGPCNGIVCFTDCEIIVLCNPTTKEFTLLPERPFGCPNDMICSWKGIGFGFDTHSNDYKVLRIVILTDRDEYTDQVLKVELYRHSSDSWKEIDYDVPRIWYADFFNLFFHGCVHWESFRDGQKVLSFNMTTEVFQEFSFPSGYTRFDEKRKSLTILNETLALLYYTGPRTRTGEQFIDVWLMKEYGIPKSWTKQFVIGPLYEINYPITSWMNTYLLLAKTNGQLTLCSFEKEETKDFEISGYPDTLGALIYKESLVSMRK